MALCLGFLAFTAVAGIQSLVVELRSSEWRGKKKKKDTVKRIKYKPQNKAEKKIFSQYASYKELLLKLSKLNIKKTTQFFKWAKDFFLIGKEFKR